MLPPMPEGYDDFMTTYSESMITVEFVDDPRYLNAGGVAKPKKDAMLAVDLHKCLIWNKFYGKLGETVAGGTFKPGLDLVEINYDSMNSRIWTFRSS